MAEVQLCHSCFITESLQVAELAPSQKGCSVIPELRTVKIHSCYYWNTSCTCSACSFCWSIPGLVWDKAALPFMSRGGWFFPSWFKSKDLFTPALPTDSEPLVCLLPFVMCERLELLFCDCWFACISLRAVAGYLTVVHPLCCSAGSLQQSLKLLL